MGLFNFFKSRRDRESAIPQSDADEIVGKFQQDTPVGQPVEGVGTAQPFGQLGGGQAMDMGSMLGMLGMIKQAYQSGNVQISQGEHVIDMRGAANGQELREQIMAAMQQAGLDPEHMPDGTQQVDASQYAGLQQNLLDVLSQHGVDVNAPNASFEVLPDLDGDGKPG
jgi:hypothetical protein